MIQTDNKKIKIILVDDNVAFRSTLKRFLQDEFQYIVEEASSGEGFFVLSNLHLADVILMDLQMPEMDGYAITKKILEDYRNARVIAITMYTEKAYLQELINTGFKGCVFKPDIFKYIQKAITTVINDQYYFPESIKI